MAKEMSLLEFAARGVLAAFEEYEAAPPPAEREYGALGGAMKMLEEALRRGAADEEAPRRLLAEVVSVSDEGVVLRVRSAAGGPNSWWGLSTAELPEALRGRLAEGMRLEALANADPTSSDAHVYAWQEAGA